MINNYYSNKILLGLSILVLFMFLPSVINFVQDNNSIKTNYTQMSHNIDYPSVFPLTDEDKEWIKDNLIKMTTREKCAQMIMPWILGKNYADDSLGLARISYLVRDLKVGGLIFSGGDVLNEASDIYNAQAIADIPLLIAADFESGPGMRLSDGTEFPDNMALAATEDSNLAFEMGKAVSEESKIIGIYQNLAPDIDINNNPDNPVIGIRAYSDDKKIVAEFGNSFIRGSLTEKVITTAKHFPGHGNTTIDSHLDLPTVSGDSTYLMNHEIYPFEQAIKNGVQAIMIGHLYVPGLEKQPGVPATLSKSIVTDLLRNKLGFNGLIMTDAMNMQAITKYYSVAEATILAVKAGNDIILMPPDEDIAVNALVTAVQSGEIDIQRINESVVRILAAKRWLKLQNNRVANFDKVRDLIGLEKNLSLAENIADRSITLVKNTRRIIPLKTDKYHNVLSVAFSFGIPRDSAVVFQALVKENFKKTNTFILNYKTNRKGYNKVLNIARRADLILIPYFIRPPSDASSEKLLKKFHTIIGKLLAARAPTILISFGDPYLLSRYPHARTYISAFSDAAVSQKSMMKALTGEINITGKLPISLVGTPYKIGYGMFLSKHITP
jgi:beta-N-acetylhexosaminidase